MSNIVGAPKFKLCFVTDGGKQLGFGHVQQSTTFAQLFVREADIRFLTKSDDTVMAKVAKRGFAVSRHSEDGGILRRLQALRPDVVVFDKLDVSEDLARNIRETMSARLAIFTNLTSANQHAHVAVTADIGSRFENVRYVDQKTQTLYLYGPRYWVLRPAFYEYWKRSKSSAQEVQRILVMFGGSDPANLTSAAVAELIRLECAEYLDIVLGAHFHHDSDLSQVLTKNIRGRTKIVVHRDISNVAELMFRSDLVLASPGLSAFEALRVGTPVIVVPHDALQRDTYRGFMQMLERDELGTLGELIKTRDFTYPTDAAIKRMEIGEGVSELHGIIVNLANKVQL